MVHNVKVITFYYHDTQAQVIIMFQISIHVWFAIIKLIIALEQGQRHFVFQKGWYLFIKWKRFEDIIIIFCRIKSSLFHRKSLIHISWTFLIPYFQWPKQIILQISKNGMKTTSALINYMLNLKVSLLINCYTIQWSQYIRLKCFKDNYLQNDFENIPVV